jgi:predicted ATPase
MEIIFYLKTKELARFYVLTEKHEYAADVINSLFSARFTEPEKYLLLAVNCLNCGFTEDSAEAVAAGLELFPGYKRLLDLTDQIGKTGIA